MAGNSAAEVVIAPGGIIRVAPLATAAPVDESAAPAAAWIDIGYVSEDGATFRFGITKDNIGAWQSMFPVRRTKTGAESSLAFAMRQWNKNNLPLAFGGGAVSVVSAGHFKYVPPAAGAAIDQRTVMVDWTDGSKVYRLVIVKATVSDVVETQLVRNAASDLPLTLEVDGLDTGDPFYLLTNDPAFA
jgi:hypothetical protein